MNLGTGGARALQVLLYDSPTGVCAVLLERYLVAAGHDRAAAIREFDRVFQALVDLNVSEGMEPLAHLPATPHRYLAMAEGSRRLTDAEVAEARSGPVNPAVFAPAFLQQKVA